MPNISGFSFLRKQSRKFSLITIVLQCPVSRAFHFYGKSFKPTVSLKSKLQCPVSRAFHFYLKEIRDLYEQVRVAMPSISGFSFLRYPSKISVKSILSNIVFASNSQNILKSLIFLVVFGFLIFC